VGKVVVVVVVERFSDIFLETPQVGPSACKASSTAYSMRSATGQA
jgi:hypothetical protein